MLGESRACRLDEGVAVRTYGHVPRHPTPTHNSDKEHSTVTDSKQYPKPPASLAGIPEEDWHAYVDGFEDETPDREVVFVDDGLGEAAEDELAAWEANQE